MAIESISDLAKCTDIEELTAQKEAYSEELKGYCATNPLCAAIMMKAGIDPEMQRFMALMAARTTFTVRIKELKEDKTDE